jgi:WD40 repeat protein
MYGTKDKVL